MQPRLTIIIFMYFFLTHITRPTLIETGVFGLGTSPFATFYWFQKRYSSCGLCEPWWGFTLLYSQNTLKTKTTFQEQPSCFWKTFGQNSGSQPGRNSSLGRNFMSSGEEFPHFSEVTIIVSFVLFSNWHYLFPLVISLIFVSYLVD